MNYVHAMHLENVYLPLGPDLAWSFEQHKNDKGTACILREEVDQVQPARLHRWIWQTDHLLSCNHYVAIYKVSDVGPIMILII